MKKFSVLLSLIMALAIFAMPMGAMAEPTTAQVIQLANPRIIMDGEEIARMDGLAAQLAYVEGSDVVQLICDVFAGGVNANSAMLQFDGESNIVGYVGGMSDPYVVNADEIIQLFMDEMAAESGIDMNSINNIVAMSESWTLPDDLMAIIEQHFMNYTMTEMGTITGESGIPLEYIQVTGDAMPMVIDILAAAENDPLVKEILNLLDPESAGVSYADELRSAGISEDFVMLIGTDSTGSIFEMKIDLSLTQNGEDLGEGYSFYMFGDSTDYSNIKIKGNMMVFEADSSISYTLTADMVLTETGLQGTLVEVAGSEVATINVLADFTDAADVFNLTADVTGYETTTLSIDYRGAETANGYDFTLDLTADSDGEAVTLNAVSSYAETDTTINYDLSVSAFDGYTDTTLVLNLYADASGVYSAKISVDPESEDPAAIGLTLTEVAPAEGADYSAVLTAEISDSVSTIEIAADLHLLTADVDTDSFYINPAVAINLLTMDDAQYTAAMTELNDVMNALGNTIAGAYPDIFGY